MNGAELDASTPVLVGVGQFSERVDGPGYQARSPVELAAEAARRACADAAELERIAPLIDTLVGVRQFEISTPLAPAPFGRSDNPPRSIAHRLGADPKRAILEITGGQSPQKLVNEWCEAIAGGQADTVLIAGGEAISTVRALSDRGETRDWSETVGGELTDRGYGLSGQVTRYQLAHHLNGAVQGYALAEHARRARLGLSRDEYAGWMGQLFAPLSRVAAQHPHAAAPIPRDTDELVTVTESNRLIADPYPRLLVSRDQVNQAAALLLTSVGTATELGVPQRQWVFLHGYADVAERPLLQRSDLGASPAAVLAACAALDAAGVGVDEVTAFDLYSCFPIAVFNLCDGLGLDPADPRGLTVTGGLPFFGGPGNNYSTHAVATLVERLREDSGAVGFIGANGGVLDKYSAGVYSPAPRAWVRCDSTPLQAEIDSWAVPPVAHEPDGPARIETYTVLFRRKGNAGIVVGRLDRSGQRFLASTDDPETLERLTGDHDEPLGAPIAVRSFGFGNRFAFTRARLPRQIGKKAAMDMILTGRRIDAEQAQQLGIVNRVAGAGQALDGARELADEVLQASPTSVRASLQLIEETEGFASEVDAARHPAAALDRLLVTEDMIEGMTAFAEKRTPQWKNR